MVECEDRGPDTNAAHRKLFARVEHYFMVELEKDPEQRKTLLRQGELIAVLSKIGKEIWFGKDNHSEYTRLRDSKIFSRSEERTDQN